MPCLRNTNNLMRSLIAVLLLSLLSSVVAGQEPPQTLAWHGLKGPVRTVETGRIEYVFRDGKSVEGRRRTYSRETFNEQGNRTEFVRYGEDGAPSSRNVYQYDALGRYTGYEGYYTLGKGPLQGPQKHLFTLDEHARIVESFVYDPGEALSSRFTYQYDARGNKLEHNMYAWTGQSMGRLVYTYDEAGHQLTETSYDRDNAVAWKSVNSYDSKGHHTEWAQYQKGVLRYKRLFKYDHKGRLEEEETLEFNAPPNMHSSHAPVPGKIVYTFDDKQRSKEIATYESNGALKSREVQTLDEHGNQVSRVFFNANGSPRNTEISFYDKNTLTETLAGKSQTEIQYDSHGNWTKKIQLILPDGAKEPRPWRGDYRNITFYKD